LASRLVIAAIVVLLTTPLAVAVLPVPNPFPDDPIPGPTDTDPANVGQWSAPFEGQVPAISAALLANGDIVYWGGIEARERDNVFFLDTPYSAEMAILHPPYTAADVEQVVIPPELGMGDFFCAGLTVLGDGRILVAGGSQWQSMMDPGYRGFVQGLKEAWTYDPATGAWERQDDMDWARWYPTVMTASDGSGLALGGIDNLVDPSTMIGEHERFDGADWAPITGADNLLPMYPRIFTVPSGAMKGDLFYETSAALWGPFGEHPLEAIWNLEQVLDTQTNTWSFLGPSVFGYRQHAITVMLPLDDADGYTARILTTGGSLGRSILATPLSEITTLGADGVTHDVAASLKHPRWMAPGVLMPDGSVLAVGGGMYDNVYAHGQPNLAVFVPERYDPASDAWTELAPATVERMYHSSALLLPDGRVLVGGHVPLPVPWTVFRDNMEFEEQVVETRFEIFEPPYLHWGYVQPTISAAPASVAFGETFTVSSPQAEQVGDAMLVRVGANTHVWDAGQRAIQLDVVERGDGTLSFLAPPDGDVATPGPWMLFLRLHTEDGIVPGVAHTIMIGLAEASTQRG
jgi:hypothetical protein